jgi:nitroreductase
MELTKAIKERRSVRKFTNHYVTDEELNEAMEAARCAPSWANTQCPEFLALRDKEKIKELVEKCYPKNPASACSLDASLVIVACYNRKKSGYYKEFSFNDIGEWGMFDLGLACQNMMLKLHDMGLGSVVVGAYDTKKASEILGIEGDIQIAAIIPVGKPVSESKMPPRKEMSKFLHIDKIK